MRGSRIRKLLHSEPFEPLRISLSDGRCLLVRHPDQVVVTERHLLVGLARIESSKPMATPRSADAVARDWMIINLLHISTIEPQTGNGHRASAARGRRAG